jgi:hypothetical protein
MKNFATTRALCICAGLLVGSAFWAINTQLGLILPYPDCRAQVRWSPLVSFTAVVIAILAGIASWRSSHSGQPKDTTLRFMGSVSGLAALIFTFALAMQGAASLMLNGCER